MNAKNYLAALLREALDVEDALALLRGAIGRESITGNGETAAWPV